VLKLNVSIPGVNRRTSGTLALLRRPEDGPGLTMRGTERYRDWFYKLRKF